MTGLVCREQIFTFPVALYSGRAEPLFVTEVMPVSRSGPRDHLLAGGAISLVTAPGMFLRSLRRREFNQFPESATPPCGAHPSTGETLVRLAGDLVDQGARDRDAHGARGEVKGAAVHVPGISTTEGNVCVR